MFIFTNILGIPLVNQNKYQLSDLNKSKTYIRNKRIMWLTKNYCNEQS